MLLYHSTTYPSVNIRNTALPSHTVPSLCVEQFVASEHRVQTCAVRVSCSHPSNNRKRKVPGRFHSLTQQQTETQGFRPGSHPATHHNKKADPVLATGHPLDVPILVLGVDQLPQEVTRLERFLQQQTNATTPSIGPRGTWCGHEGRTVQAPTLTTACAETSPRTCCELCGSHVSLVVSCSDYPGVQNPIL